MIPTAETEVTVVLTCEEREQVWKRRMIASLRNVAASYRQKCRAHMEQIPAAEAGAGHSKEEA